MSPKVAVHANEPPVSGRSLPILSIMIATRPTEKDGSCPLT